MAKMRFEIILAPEVVQDLQKLKTNVRTAVKEALETHLRHEQPRLAKAESSDCVGSRDRSIGSESKRCVCFTTFQAPPSRY